MAANDSPRRTHAGTRRRGPASTSSPPIPSRSPTWVDAAGYPDQRRRRGPDRPDRPDGHVRRAGGPGLPVIPTDRMVSLTGSHIRPQPGYGYDERRHVTVWGPATRAGTSAHRLRAHGVGLGRAETPFFEYSERSVRQSRRYFDALSAERGTPVKPRLSFAVG